MQERADVRPGGALAGSTAAALTDVSIFRAAAGVRHRVGVEIAGCRYPISPVSAGFLSLHADLFPAAHDVATDALGMGRPVVLSGDGAEAAARLTAAVGGSRWIRAHGPEEVHFVVPARFVRDRAAALGRRLPRRPPRPDAPHQHLTAVGVGPRPLGTQAEILGVLDRAEAVVATDWTYANTLPRLLGAPLPRGPGRHVVPYDITDYDATISGVDDVLTALQGSGVREVALLVEGNPDTYDVLDGVRLDRRRLHVVPGVPIALVAAAEFGARLTPSPFASQLAYLSGLPLRHEQTPAELRVELGRYLAAGVSCVLVEMTFGDLGLAVQAARAAGPPKVLALLTDRYSPDAREMVASAASPDQTRALLEQAKGTLSTLLIFDAPAGGGGGG
ncbi:hypothetical protein [Actinomadura xylanilytica]|uniref:hypothetical protein n=1 Tax=Actinomadura xylanilytica TaxID=887459 RepID=UPI00255B3AE0|nr:hypothetical protein [Actinomadura xylanilytica]MDL4776700.1 hypothetical protein [Actinomadura xylanilytica]